MEIRINVENCNECPYFREHVDHSVCYDSFDEPNYEHYCAHPSADNSGTCEHEYNNVNGQFIECAFSEFYRTCEIPEWCPFDASGLHRKDKHQQHA